MDAETGMRWVTPSRANVVASHFAHVGAKRSLLITANQPFGQWDKIFPEPAMTVAARRSKSGYSRWCRRAS